MANIDEFIEIINSNFKESDFFELNQQINNDDYDDYYYNFNKKESKLLYIDRKLKMVLYGFMSSLSNNVFLSEYTKVVETILKLSSNSLKTMLFLELFMNIVYNDKTDQLPNITKQILGYIASYSIEDNIDYLQHFRDRITSDKKLTYDDIYKLIPIYHEFLLGESDESFDSLAKFEILSENFNSAVIHAKNDITKFHSHVMFGNFNEAFELFKNILSKNEKLTRDEATIISKLFNLIGFASDDQLNYLVNSCYNTIDQTQPNINKILPYDWDETNIFANIVLKTFTEKHNRFAQNPDHSLDKLADFNLSRISIICIANIVYENYDFVEELIRDYRNFCKSIGRSTQYELMSNSETAVVRNMLVDKYLSTDNQAKINRLIANFDHDDRGKVNIIVRLQPNELIANLKASITGGYFYSSCINHALTQLQQVGKYEISLAFYEHYHKYNTKCGFHCNCSHIIAEMIEKSHDIAFVTKILTKVLLFSSSEHLYDQITDLVAVAERVRQNSMKFNNEQIKEFTTRMNKYYPLFMINVFCPQIGKLFNASLFEKEPERKMD